jgi:pyruvate/2-oxoglutarate/acetoin dehydrogenase E1 component
MADSRTAVAEQNAKSKLNGATLSESSAGPVTFLEAIKQALFEEMERDPAVVLLGEDVGVYGGAFKTSEGLLERFGWERVIDTPISESAIIGAACGMSYLGLRPIAEMQFIDFIACCFNQLTNFVAKGRRRAWRTVSLRQSRNVFRAHSGIESHLPVDALRRQGPIEGRHPRQ